MTTSIYTRHFILFVLVFISTFAQAQQIVQGKVISLTDHTPIPGVNIVLQGTTTGTVTDTDGQYQIRVPSEEAVLVFSFIGFDTEIIQVNGRTKIDVALSLSFQELMQVVVMGYSEKKKSEITGAVSTISAEQLQGVTGSNVEYMLQGKVAGVQVSSTGAPGAPAEIRIRGQSSLAADRGPLVVVDGIIGGSYNPNDVESITVLKDAGAIALYGSRANAGVLVVTTKRGKSDQMEVNYRGTYGKRQITTGNFELMNAQELYDTERLMFASSATFNNMRPATLLENETDWLGLAYKDGVIQNHNISFSGKSGKIGYYLGGDYYLEEGTLLSTRFERFNFRSNLDFEISKAIKLVTNLNILNNNNNGYHWTWPYQPFLYLPYDSPYDENGNIRYVDGNTSGFLSRDKFNVLHSALYNDYKSRGFTMNGDVILSARITSFLTLETRNRLSYSTNRSDTYEDSKTIEGVSNNGILSYGFWDGYSAISTNLIKMGTDFGAHHVGGFIGFEGQHSSSESAGGTGYGIVSGIKIPGAVAAPQGITGSRFEANALSFLSELSYDYKNKYFLSASFRRDGSSIFAENKRWGNFGAISASWLLSNEPFFEPFVNVATLFKIRGSYGIIGNDAIPPFQHLAKYQFTTQYNGGSAGYPESLPNPDLGWEQTKASDIGIDMTLFHKIDVTFDAFHKDTDQLLLKVQLPPSQGISEIWRNAGRVINKGVELGISGDIINRSLFKWSVNVNFGSAANRVKSLATGMTSVAKTYDGLKQSVQVGHDINSWNLPKWVGVDPESGDPLWEKAVLDGDGNITGYENTNNYSEASSPSSLQFVGSATPKFYGGLSTAVTYKQFSLSISTSYQYGNKIYHRTREFVDADGALFNFNMMKLQEDWSRWQNPGDNATHPKPVMGGNNLANKPSSRYIEDGSFLRVRNINLSYNIPVSLFSRVKLSRANIFISGDNLFTFTKFSGMDPEVSIYGEDFAVASGVIRVPGLSTFRYPLSKQYLAGIQISF